MTRTRTPSTEIEASILAAAEALLETEGPESLTIRRIASQAGVAPMGVYNHFSSKNGVIEELFCVGFERLRQNLEELQHLTPPLQALDESGIRYRALALERPGMYHLLFGRSIEGFEPSEHSMELAAETFLGLVRLVERCVASGEIRAGDPTMIAQMFWASLHGWVSLELTDMNFVADLDAGATEFRQTLLRGFQP